MGRGYGLGARWPHPAPLGAGIWVVLEVEGAVVGECHGLVLAIGSDGEWGLVTHGQTFGSLLNGGNVGGENNIGFMERSSK